MFFNLSELALIGRQFPGAASFLTDYGSHLTPEYLSERACKSEGGMF